MVAHGGGASSGETSSGTSGGGSGGGGGGDAVKQSLKKGPWTAAEDAMLIEYVKKHGEGNWNAVQRNSGLSRCGKSCRLRWANHLRPNLKKGAFSSDEERLIIELHAKLGNKWARMAAQLPGRTDNEIKNYWNTRTKRRQRAGLPLYPQEIQRDAAALHLHHYHQRQQRHHQQQNPHSSPSSLPSFLSPSRNQKPTYNPPLSLFDPIKFHQNSSFISNTHHQFRFLNDTHNGNFTLPYPSSSSSSPFNQTLANTTTAQLLPTQSLQFNSASYNFEFNPSAIVGAATTSFEPNGLIPLLKPTVELPSSQTTPLQSTPTNSSAATSGGDYMIGASSSANDYVVAPPMSRGNSGLLDDLLKQAQDLSRNEKSRGEQQLLAQWDDSSSAQSSIGIKSKKEPMEDMNSMDDELTSLLETFPSTMPVPEWYRQSRGSSSGDVSNGQSSSSLIGRNAVLDINGQEASPSPAAAATGMDHGLILDSCCWNNMPSIC